MRAQGNVVHILVISAQDGWDDRLAALDAGADDYLVKPFPLTEALARVCALLRRIYVKKSLLMRVADLELESSRRAMPPHMPATWKPITRLPPNSAIRNWRWKSC